VEKVATMAAAEASVAAATILMLVAMRGGGGYGDPPRDITKWSLGAGGAISLHFFCDKLTNLGWLTLSITPLTQACESPGPTIFFCI
jgi:hypothetical protein